MVRWWWFGTAVTKPEILHELQQMEADGIGGAELAFVYPEVVDNAKGGLENLPFLSPAMLDAVRYAQTEGRRLGLRIDVTLGSGWPYGGRATKLSEAAARLRTFETPIAPSQVTVKLPEVAEGDVLVSASVADGAPKHWDAATARPLDAGTLRVEPSDRARVALFFYAGHTGQQVKRAAVGAEGYVLDPFSREAVATHLRSVGEPLLNAFGSTPPYAVFSDSLEAYGADWTTALPAEFRKRRGYDLIPHLAELVAGGSAEAERVRHDWGRTLTELVDENYLTQINDWASAHHTRFRSQTYGEPAVSLSSQRLVALPEGEGPQWRGFSTLRWASSGNHIFGNKVTSGETFTWLHSPVFRATPLDMKAEADIDFIMGENQLIFHGWPYSAAQAGEPGWSLYAAAVFNDHNPWHPVMPAVTAYMARMSYLLRQGAPANQVAVLLPTDDAWASFAPAHASVSEAMQKLLPREMFGAILSAGYNYDFIDADAMDRRGIHHSIVVVPPTDRMPLATLRSLAVFVRSGGKVVALGRAPSMDADGKTIAEVTDLSRELFGGRVVKTASSLGDALHRATKSDLAFGNSVDAATKDAVGFIRRKLPSGDIYFVVNTSNRDVHAAVSLATEFHAGTSLDPDTGLALGAIDADVDLKLAPYESRVYVFGDASRPHSPRPAGAGHSIDLSHDWKVTFAGTGLSRQEREPADWTASSATLHYSGEAVYVREFTLAKGYAKAQLAVDGGIAVPDSLGSPADHPVLGANGLPNPLVTHTGPGMHAYFDPPIREAALVVINGKPAGALWHPPYRLDATGLLHAGVNRIEIHVYNTALNAWSAQPPHDYKPLVETYGDRFQMQDLDKVKPLPSGLLGPVRLLIEE